MCSILNVSSNFYFMWICKYIIILSGRLEKINDVLEKINIQENEPTTSQKHALRIKKTVPNMGERPTISKITLMARTLQEQFCLFGA